MEKTTVIKVLKNPNVADLAGEKVMVDFEQGKYFMLKGVGGDIWEKLKDDITVGEVVAALLEEYSVDEAVCYDETVKFLEKLVEIEFISVK